MVAMMISRCQEYLQLEGSLVRDDDEDNQYVIKNIIDLNISQRTGWPQQLHYQWQMAGRPARVRGFLNPQLLQNYSLSQVSW